jgi:hypothetical protein
MTFSQPLVICITKLLQRQQLWQNPSSSESHFPPTGRATKKNEKRKQMPHDGKQKKKRRKRILF